MALQTIFQVTLTTSARAEIAMLWLRSWSAGQAITWVVSLASEAANFGTSPKVVTPHGLS